MAYYNFNKDLIDGKAAEEQAIELIAGKYNIDKNDFSVCENKEYDFKIISKNITFEVKNDLMAHKTGNVAIEYESRGKQSGLLVTKADFWIYKIDNEFIMLKTTRLKEELFDKKNFYRNVSGGDMGSNTKMFLVKTDSFRNWGLKIN